MIKVNLIGVSRKKARAGFKLPVPTGGLPIFLILIVLASAAYSASPMTGRNSSFAAAAIARMASKSAGLA